MEVPRETVATLGENGLRPSLFQRLFHCSKSVAKKPLSSKETSLSELPIPPHRDKNGEEAIEDGNLHNSDENQDTIGNRKNGEHYTY